MTEEQIENLKAIIGTALEKLYACDNQLIVYGVNERAIAFRFGLYLSDLIRDSEDFCDLHVDAEYNRNMDDVKRTASRPRGSAPDILLHQRMTHENNALILEFKGYW
ncbi:MAG: hypothetical protein WBA23_18095, partial [Tunicatimonas sp.]|uniref:hypothetical protein n=1 Tax=Tunicatimonas sp. TaxID=1940096 RepID=UPI003C74DC0F